MRKIVFGGIKSLPIEIEDELKKDFMESKNLILQFTLNRNSEDSKSGNTRKEKSKEEVKNDVPSKIENNIPEWYMTGGSSLMKTKTPRENNLPNTKTPVESQPSSNS